MKIIYDDETQVALDELDKNIANRHQYLAVNFTFHWHDFYEDPILQQLQKIKSNLLSTATVKAIEYDDQEMPYLGKGESFVDEADMYPVNLKKKMLLVSTPSHAVNKIEQAFAASNAKAERFICKHEDLINDTYNDRMFEREIIITKSLSAGKTEELIKSNIDTVALGKAMHEHFDKEFDKAVGNFGDAVYNAGEAAKASAEELRTAMEKMRPVKAPVFDELDRFHDEPLPKSLAVRRMKFPDSEEEFNKQLDDHLQQMKVEVRANHAAINDECEKHLNEDTE